MNILHNISLCLLLGLLLSASVTEAAFPEGRHGWLSASALIGDDITCGSGKVRMDLELLEYGTNNPITVPSAVIEIYAISNGASVFSSSGPGPVVPSLCMNPLTEGFIFDISGGSSYYDFWSASQWQTANPLPTGKHYRYTVWLAPAPSPAHFTQVSPVNTIVKVNPSYELSLASFPATYGATGAQSLSFFLRKYNSVTNKIGAKVDGRIINLSGGVGIKTIPPTPGLADGMYTWAGYLQLNGINSIPDGSLTINFEDVSKSPLIAYNWPFMLDSTSPVVATSSGHVPVSPSNNDIVTLTGQASDNLSGITQMKIYINGVDSRTCNFASVNSALCDTKVGPYAASSTVSYFFTATDFAGNTATSSVMSFEVISLTQPPSPPPVGVPLTCTIPGSQVEDSSAMTGTPQSLKVVGNYAYVGASGVDAGNGLYIYDISDASNIVQTSFFSTHNPASVQNNSWGNDALGLDVEGSYAYLATYLGGLVIVDISNPSAPTYVGKVALQSLNTPGLTETWAVEVVGNYAYMAAGKGMIVVDVSNKANPTVVQNINLGAAVSQDIAVLGNYAYVVLRDDGIAIFDITNPLNIVTVSTFNDAYNGSNWAYAVEVSGNYLYVGNHFAGTIRIYDVSTKSNPVFMASATIPGSLQVRGLYIENATLYVGAGEEGAYVFDLSNPISPKLLYQVTDPELLSSSRVWDVTPLPGGNFTDILIISEDADAGLYVIETTCNSVFLPDLVSTSTQLSASAVSVGDTITFSTGPIVNNGTAIASPYSLSGFYVDTNSDGTAEYTATLSGQTATTNVGSSTQLSVDWSVPEGAPNGTYAVGYMVNDPNGFSEIDYDNNWSGWTTFIVSKSAAPVVSALLASPNPITLGDSTDLSWSISGTADWCWLEGAGGGWQDPTSGSKKVTVTPIATETYTIECGNTSGNSDIESRTVTVNTPASASLSATGCYIAASSSTCLGTVSWEFVNGIAPFSVRNTTNGELYGTSESETLTPALLEEGLNTIVASDAAGFSVTEVVVGICDSALNTWNSTSNVCVANPPAPVVEMSTEFDLVRTGAAAPIVIEITSAERLTCTLINAQDSELEFTHDPALGVAQSYDSYTTKPLTSAQVVTVTCVIDAFPTVSTTSERRISVIGILEEV